MIFLGGDPRYNLRSPLCAFGVERVNPNRPSPQSHGDSLFWNMPPVLWNENGGSVTLNPIVRGIRNAVAAHLDAQPTTHTRQTTRQREKQAGRAYYLRSVRLDSPAGRLRGRVWNPAGHEILACCWKKRASGLYPYNLLIHCRTARHVAVLYQVERRAVLR